MSLEKYFSDLIEKVESSKTITNQGKDKDGFFQPTRDVLLKELNLLRDLHQKPLAKQMLKRSWNFVVENLPPEMLVMGPEEKTAIKRMLQVTDP